MIAVLDLQTRPKCDTIVKQINGRAGQGDAMGEGKQMKKTFQHLTVAKEAVCPNFGHESRYRLPK